LLAVVEAADSYRLCSGPAERRQQQRRQDGDDGDNHQQFDEGKAESQVTGSICGGCFHAIETSLGFMIKLGIL
jgi:hypothetical protein